MSFEISASENFAKGLKRLSKKYPSIKEDMLQLAGSLSNESVSRYSAWKILLAKSDFP